MKRHRENCGFCNVTVFTEYDGKFKFVHCIHLGMDRDCQKSGNTCEYWTPKDIEIKEGEVAVIGTTEFI